MGDTQANPFSGAEGDVYAGISDAAADGSPLETTPKTETPKTDGAPAADPLDAVLDAWEKGPDAGTSQGRESSNDPMKGLDPNHPVLRGLIEDRQRQDRESRKATAARELMKSGAIAKEAIPEFLDFIDGVMELKSQHEAAMKFLQDLDSSDLVLSAHVNKMVKQYGKYGVTADDLKMVARPGSSAKELEAVAKTLAVRNRKQGVTARAKAGADTVEDTRPRGSSAGADYMDLTKSAESLIYSGMKG